LAKHKITASVFEKIEVEYQSILEYKEDMEPVYLTKQNQSLSIENLRQAVESVINSRNQTAVM
jgi:hypothetical protein